MRKILCCFFLLGFIRSEAQVTTRYQNNQTPTYQEVDAFYKQLAATHPQQTRYETKGKTDVGVPLHVFWISADGDFEPTSINRKRKCTILINNGIHPGEPDGIDASMKLAQELLENNLYQEWLSQVVIAIIPVYNIDGALNRGCCSRANQDGPEQYGFRGNARNLDLNRDFIKCDSRNAQSFTDIFQSIKPDLLVDNHVSDGADYPYTLTLIASQHNKLTKQLGEYTHQIMVPALFKALKAKGQEMAPYVDTKGETPESGIQDFLETPRFSTGYAALFNTIGFVVETHMLKPYKQRVEATHQFLQALIQYTYSHHEEIKHQREEAIAEVIHQSKFALQWELDTTQHTFFDFSGYEASYKTSRISGLTRLYYDRNKTYKKPIPYYQTYRTSAEVEKPLFYVVPQAWKEVVERLQWNGVQMQQVKKDTMIEQEVYYIADYHTVSKPYEGHYLHNGVQLTSETQKLPVLMGDYLVYVNQPANRYIVETLEPKGVDSFFAWNFFDSVLQQKEWFSDYVFEEKAEEILKQQPELKSEFFRRRANDKQFADNHFAQLLFIYQHSPYFEKSYNRYPIGRVKQ